MLVEIGSYTDTPRVFSCTGTVGVLLCFFFGVDVDVVVALSGSIVLCNYSLQLTSSSLLASITSTFVVLYGNSNDNNLFMFDPSTSFILGWTTISKLIRTQNYNLTLFP